MDSGNLWLIPLMAFTIAPTMVFGLGIALAFLAEFFDWLVELWERKWRK